MWNCDPGSWFNVELWPGVINPRWIVTSSDNSTFKCDPGSRFHVENRSRVMIPRWKVTPGFDSTLKYEPRSEFHVELWPRVMIKRWIVTWAWGHNSMWNSDPGSYFNVEFWHGLKIQRGISTPGHNSTWNSDPSTYFLPVELRRKMVSKFNSVIKIQQLRRVTVQRKIHLILTPGRYSIVGSKFYLTPAYRYRQTYTCISTLY